MPEPIENHWREETQEDYEDALYGRDDDDDNAGGADDEDPLEWDEMRLDDE